MALGGNRTECVLLQLSNPGHWNRESNPMTYDRRILPLARADGGMKLVGSRTECALLQLAGRLGADYQAAREATATLRAFPFSSERKRMSTLTRRPGARSARSPMLLPSMLSSSTKLISDKLGGALDFFRYAFMVDLSSFASLNPSKRICHLTDR